MVNLSRTDDICQGTAVLALLLILVLFTFQCLRFKQLNYDLYTTYSILTKVAWGRIGISMTELLFFLIYDFYSTGNANKAMKWYHIGAVLSALVPFLHLLFFVLRLYMTFFHTNYPISYCSLVSYLISVFIVFGMILVYELLGNELIVNDISDFELNVLFWVFTGFRFFLLFILSIHFTVKLISLITNHYSTNENELSRVGMLKYENFHILNNLTSVHNTNNINHNNNNNNNNNNNANNSNLFFGNKMTISLSPPQNTEEISKSRSNVNEDIIAPSNSNYNEENFIFSSLTNSQTWSVSQPQSPNGKKAKMKKVNKTSKHFKERNLSFSLIQLDLIKVVTKQTVLTLMDVMILAIYFSYVIIFEDEIFAPKVNPIIPTVYFILSGVGNVAASITVWLSFSFAEKEYYYCCKPCDKCCLKASKCVTKSAIGTSQMDQMHQIDFEL